MRQRLAGRLLGTRLVRDALAQRIDIKSVPFPPPPRVFVGLLLLGGSYLLAWPAMALAALAATWLHDATVALLGPPTCYALSWGTFLLGSWLIGPAGMKQGVILGLWLVQRMAAWLARDEHAHSATSDDIGVAAPSAPPSRESSRIVNE
jgi:hypothetical protein